MAYGSARVVLEQGWAKKASKQSGEEEEEGGPIGGLGGTEVVAGIKLEVVTGDGVAPAETPDQKRGTEQWRCKVEVDVTPQAFPHLSTQALSSLSSRYSNLLVDHFVPFLPPLTILPNKKYFQPQIHLTVLSASSGSVIPTLFLAARCAFANLHVPLTKSIGWEAVVGDGMDEDGPGERAGTGFGGGEGGISGAVRAAKGNQALPRGIPVDDWDLEDLGGGEEGEGELLDNEVRKGLPVCVTLNLVSGSPEFLCLLSRHLFTQDTHLTHFPFPMNRSQTRIPTSLTQQTKKNPPAHQEYTSSSPRNPAAVLISTSVESVSKVKMACRFNGYQDC